MAPWNAKPRGGSVDAFFPFTTITGKSNSSQDSNPGAKKIVETALSKRTRYYSEINYD